MADSHDVSVHRVCSAWRGLFHHRRPHHIGNAFKRGAQHGLVFFRPLGALSFPDTGPIVLLNREPWGIVTMALSHNEVAGLWTISGGDCDYDAASGSISASIEFSHLDYTGNYQLRRGNATASPLKMAVKSLKVDYGRTDGDLGDSGPIGRIPLAKDYQSQLSGSPSGRFMLSNYYEHNSAYADAFNNGNLNRYWKTYKTSAADPANPVTTEDCANDTSHAAQPGNVNSVPVNQNANYTPHSLFMNLAVMAACNAQNNTAAADAASSFSCVTEPYRDKPQTVANVMNTVQTTPPPSRVNAMLANIGPEKFLEQHIQQLPVEMHEDARTMIAEIHQEEEDVRKGLVIREETKRPIDGDFGGHFAWSGVRITGRVTQRDHKGNPLVEFTELAGNPPDVTFCLSTFPGRLHGAVEAALDDAKFIKTLLGTHVLSAVRTSSLLGDISRMMTVALGSEVEDSP
jgi:hypothetical protein